MFGEFGVGLSLGDEVLEVGLGTFHDNVGILLLGVLIDVHDGDEVANILDHAGAHFGHVLHEGNFLQKILIFII